MSEDHNSDEMASDKDRSSVNRRSFVKIVGATGVLGSTGVVGSAQAQPMSDQSDVQTPNVNTENISKSETLQYYNQIEPDTPTQEISQFLKNEQGYVVDPQELSGTRVSGAEIPEYISLRTTFPTSSDSGELELRVIDDKVGAEATIGNTAYLSNQFIIDNSEQFDDTVVTSTELQQQQASSGEFSAAGLNCFKRGTFDVGGPACAFLSAITVIAGGVLTLIPEPSSTAVGTVAISTILSGGCNLANVLDKNLAKNCNVTKLGICVKPPSVLNPTPQTLVYPVDCV